jgi:hypothetical protein
MARFEDQNLDFKSRTPTLQYPNPFFRKDTAPRQLVLKHGVCGTYTAAYAMHLSVVSRLRAPSRLSSLRLNLWGIPGNCPMLDIIPGGHCTVGPTCYATASEQPACRE